MFRNKCLLEATNAALQCSARLIANAVGCWFTKPREHMFHELSATVSDTYTAIGRGSVGRQTARQQQKFRPTPSDSAASHQRSTKQA